MVSPRAESGPEPNAAEGGAGGPTETTVSSYSPPYPKHRDAVIIGSVILAIVLIFAGAYFFTKGTTAVTLPDFIKKPFGTIGTLFSWPDVQKKCEFFLRQNEKRFSHLGRPLRFSLIKQEINVSNGEKTAKITAKVRGPSGTNNVYFLLEKREGDWSVTSAVLEQEDGRYEMLQNN
jgi:hypothetical protein